MIFSLLEKRIPEIEQTGEGNKIFRIIKINQFFR